MRAVLVGAVLISVPLVVSAQIGPPPGIPSSFEEFAEVLIEFMTYAAVAIAPLVFMAGGFMFLTASGSPDKISQGKSLMMWAAIGLGVILIANGLVTALQSVIGSDV